MSIRRMVQIFGIGAVTALPLILILAPGVVASPPQPTYDTATVDGDLSEWDLTEDFFANMYRAAKPEKLVESKLYLRYDCSTHTLYALVLPVENLVIQTTHLDNSYIKIDNSKLVDGSSPPPPGSVFQWINKVENTALGWEASGSLGEGSYALNVHTDVRNEETQTSAVVERNIDLLINCYAPPKVGREVYSVNKLAVLAPWIGLIAAIILITTMAVRHQRIRS